MRKGIPVVSTAVLFTILQSCRSSSASDPIATDAASISSGKDLFTLNCSGCHNFTQDGIGPQLRGLTGQVTVGWLRNFIRDPQQVITSGDARAQELHNKYPAGMPPFQFLKDEDINHIIAFIHSQGAGNRQAADDKALQNPIPESIKPSGLVVGLQVVTQIPSSSSDGRPPAARITKLGFQPASNYLFVVDLRGKLYRLQNNSATVYMDMTKLRPKFISEPGLATGFGSFAFHPDFVKNGILYTTHTESAGSGKADFAYEDSIKVTLQWVLTEWKTNDPTASTFMGTGRELMRINMVTGIHGVQEIAFNPLARKGEADYGLLYIGVGDGGAVENGHQSLAHSKEKVWGSILRIDPAGKNSANGQYGIPSGNPFSHDPDPHALKEIYAYGFRNPHRFSWSKDGKMISCNIGQANIESLYFVEPGHDYGWPMREGSFVLNPYGDLTKVYPAMPNDSVYGISYPVAEYDHDEGKAISGGFEYSGTLAALKGRYLFGDIPTGRLFYVDMNELKEGKQATIHEWDLSVDGKPATLKALCGNDRIDLHFGKDAKGELYVLTKADGKIYKLASAKMQSE